MKNVRKSFLTRKHFLQVAGLIGSGLGSGLALSACSEVKAIFDFVQGENMSDREILDKKSAKDFILSELCKRYSEEFIQTAETDISQYDPDRDNEICYEVLVAPKARPHEIFTSVLHVHADTNRQAFPVMDNYQQYLFTPIVCKPFEEYLVNQDSIDGYAVKLTWNKMDDEVWTADQVEQYMGFGVDGDPVVGMLVIVPRTTPEEVSQIIYDSHIDCSKFNRNMRLVFGLTGCDMRDSRNNIYGTHLDYMYLNTRKDALLSYSDILDEIATQMKIVKETGWDGIGRVGDPNNVVSSVTWKQKKQ